MTYEIKTVGGEIVVTLTGSELQDKGFVVDLEGLYSGNLYEVSIKQ
jgi:hypothetical protein